eukprot:CAMPEP_0117655296 /NCGR_PEP_ID=MMETSP0804-20121206/4205_1 /TAXON_ID=1074897 /ORGANISM="Tetraselmis astigmatica, Strain CCMP880" /LENGTH=161 /DNA_ID=CAMNT_0005461641 /DNA_START=490 /DNA_END=975 /DNA_ORIENTATION=-
MNGLKICAAASDRYLTGFLRSLDAWLATIDRRGAGIRLALVRWLTGVPRREGAALEIISEAVAMALSDAHGRRRLKGSKFSPAVAFSLGDTYKAREFGFGGVGAGQSSCGVVPRVSHLRHPSIYLSPDDMHGSRAMVNRRDEGTVARQMSVSPVLIGGKSS